MMECFAFACRWRQCLLVDKLAALVAAKHPQDTTFPGNETIYAIKAWLQMSADYGSGGEINPAI